MLRHEPSGRLRDEEHSHEQHTGRDELTERETGEEGVRTKTRLAEENAFGGEKHSQEDWNLPLNLRRLHGRSEDVVDPETGERNQQIGEVSLDSGFHHPSLLELTQGAFRLGCPCRRIR